MGRPKVLNSCDGSGSIVSFGRANLDDQMRCPHCGIFVNLNKNGSIRKHEARTVVITDPTFEFEPPEPVSSVWEMRENATQLKTQLWHTFSISQDPRFKRLWQLALALETHLTRIHDDQSYGSATVQLMAYRAGDVE